MDDAMIASAEALKRLVTRDFRRGEYACKCLCGLCDPHPALVMGVQLIRSTLAVSVTVSSGCRCDAHNRRPPTELNERGIPGAGGSSGSFHRPRPDMAGYCCAADLHCELSLRDIRGAARYVHWITGIGAYVADKRAWLHVDVRGVTGLHAAWAQGYIDGKRVALEAALVEDERRRALRTLKEQRS